MLIICGKEDLNDGDVTYFNWIKVSMIGFISCLTITIFARVCPYLSIGHWLTIAADIIAVLTFVPFVINMYRVKS